MGLISLSGPISSIMIALIFYGLGYFGGILGTVGMQGFTLNLWLAAFNLIPLGVMDGRKVFAWSPIVWGLVAIPTWIMTLTF